MKIKLLRLKLTNFKGQRSTEIIFNPQQTDLHGANRSGKTTISDAITWLLFGKDSEWKTDFSLKTLDTDNNPIHHLDHNVTAVLSIDGEVQTLSRTLKEDWVTKRGEAIPELKGNKTEYFINDVPKKAKEYQEYINSLIDENLFRCLFNPYYFNKVIDWKERREILIRLSGETTNTEILDTIANLSNKDDILIITNLLNSKKTLTEHKKELAFKRKALKEKLEQIPVRISETSRDMPEEQDFAITEKQIKEIQTRLNEIDNQLTDRSKLIQKEVEKKQAIANEHLELHRRAVQIKTDIENEIIRSKTSALNTRNSYENKIHAARTNRRDKQFDTGQCEKEIVNNQAEAAQLKETINQLGRQWEEVNTKQYTAHEDLYCCPTCNQRLPEENIGQQQNQLRQSFADNKEKELAAIEQQAKQKKTRIKDLNDRNHELNERITLNNEEITQYDTIINDNEALLEAFDKAQQEPESGIEQKLSEHKEYQKLLTLIALKQAESETITTTVTTDDLSEQKHPLNEKLKELNVQLSAREIIARKQNRIEELKQEERKYSQEHADLEKTELLITGFEKRRMELIGEKVNKMFSVVQFKLFDTQMNGGESECCIAMVNGVPYPDLNTESQINAGLDVINVLSSHYNISCPVIIDNRESVTEIIPVSNQTVNLIVNPEHKTVTSL